MQIHVGGSVQRIDANGDCVTARIHTAYREVVRRGGRHIQWRVAVRDVKQRRVVLNSAREGQRMRQLATIWRRQTQPRIDERCVGGQHTWWRNAFVWQRILDAQACVMG